MPNSYQISESEWKVMQALWEHGSMYLKELIEILQPETGWNGNTIRTLVVRLVEKQAVSAEKSGRNYCYSAIATEQDCVMQETERFIHRVFGDSPARMFAALSSGGKLTSRDVAEIEAMIAALRERDIGD